MPRSMAKSKSKGVPDEKCLVLPRHNDMEDAADIDLIDTHTHVISTYETYRSKYAKGKHQSVREFVQALLLQDESHRVSKVVDVWCEAPLKAEWRDTVEQLSSIEDFAYHFVVGVSLWIFLVLSGSLTDSLLSLGTSSRGERLQ